MGQPLLKRVQIAAQLDNIFEHPLTLVVAAMGYGKTTAVRDYLDQKQARYAWLTVEREERSAQLVWHSLTRQLARIELEFGSQLNTMGFPADVPHGDRILDLIEEHTFMTGTVLVFDDYHFARAPELDTLLERLVWRKIPGLHIVIISRTRPQFNMAELKLKDHCFQLKSSLFELSPDEIKEYVQMFGYNPPPGMINRVHTLTEGWITAGYLVMRNYAETGLLGQVTDIEALLESAIMARYKDDETQLLAALSILESFTPEQAPYLTGNKKAAAMIRQLSSDNSLIRYDDQAGKYILHNIFRTHLKGLVAEQFDQLELAGLYRRAGEWEVQNNNLIPGLQYFLQAGAYDLFLDQFEKPGISRVLDTSAAAIVELFEQVPEEARLRHPIAYITYADFYLTDVDMEGGGRLLDKIEKHFRSDPDTPHAMKRRIFGEITLARSFLFFNDIRKINAYHLKAHDLLEGRSAIANKEMMFTFGSPHCLYLFYREKGDLLEVTEFSAQAIRPYLELSNGCGAGFEHLIRAEYCLETGTLDQVEHYVQKAIHKAHASDQSLIIICANFALARQLAAVGRLMEARAILNELQITVAEINNPIFDNTMDLCAGYLGGILADKQSFAPWLKDGDMKHSDIFYQGLAFNYLVHAKFVLLEENYSKLELLCEELHQLFSIFNNQLGYVHAHLLDAIARNRLYGPEEAKEALRPALVIGRADSLILPFAEYGLYIGDLLRAMQRENPTDRYLNRLAEAAARYRAELRRHGEGGITALFITKREKEILALIVAGKTNRQIAASLYLAEVTVKKSITAIYRKLGASGRAEAVRKALELGIGGDSLPVEEEA
jgi:LuxR family transcriptional regulator, maltose regulon positive regulatory protein